MTTLLRDMTSGSVNFAGWGILAHTHTGTTSDAFTIVAIVDALRKPVTSKTAAEGRSFTVDVVGESFVVRVRLTERRSSS